MTYGPLLLMTLLLSWRADPPDAGVARQTVPRTYVLAYTEALRSPAERWARFRERDGWSVHTLEVAPDRGMGDPRERARQRATELRSRIVAAYAAHRDRSDGQFMVLLLGDTGPQGIPTWSFPQHDPLLRARGDSTYVSDHPYQQMDLEDDLPDVPLGRIPARTVAEAWKRRVNYAAGEGRFGSLDLLLEFMFRNMIERIVPDEFDISMTYAKSSSFYCPPPDRVTDVMLERLGEGALLFNYVGHGGPQGLDRLELPGRSIPLLHNGDLERLDRHEPRPTIALLTCCSAGWFDLPGGEACLGEMMLLNAAGPVAVIAGSRPTHPYANTVLQKDVAQLLLVDRVTTVGELDLLATRSMLEIDAMDRELDLVATPIALAGRWETSLRGLRHMHVRLYNLLGDPATRIAHARGSVEDLKLVDGRVRGIVRGVDVGRALVTIETASTAMARPDAVRAVRAGDPNLAETIARNYALANDRVLWRREVDLREGRFDVTLPEPMPARAAVLKVYAWGRGHLPGDPTVDAFAATAIKRPQ
jgi:hypothetical protein